MKINNEKKLNKETFTNNFNKKKLWLENSITIYKKTANENENIQFFMNKKSSLKFSFLKKYK